MPSSKTTITITAPTVDAESLYETVEKMYKMKTTIDRATAKLAELRAMVEPVAASERTRLERVGSFSKTVTVIGSVHNAVFQFKDSFSKIDLSDWPDMLEKLGNVARDLFVTAHTYRARPGKEDELLRTLGDRADELLEHESWIETVDKFRHARAVLRNGGVITKIIDTALDAIVAKIAHRPTLSFK
jgi:hypothetical protein